MSFGFFGHFLNFGLVKIAGTGNGNALLFAGAFVFGGDIQDAVGIDVKGNFDLRNAARRRRNAVENEAAEDLVAVDHVAFALRDMDFHLRLIVGGGRKDFGLYWSE